MRFFWSLPLVAAVCASAAKIPVDRRGFAVRPWEGAEPTSVDPPEDGGTSGEDGGTGGEGGDTSGVSGGNSGETYGEIGVGQVEGTASQSTNPCENEGEDDESLEILETAKEVLDKISDAIQNAQGSTPTTAISPNQFQPTSVAGANVSSSTSNTTMLSGNGSYIAADDPSLPSVDVAEALSAQGGLSNWSELFTYDEYDMYKDQPLCFYVNIVSMYLRAWAGSVASAASSGSDAATTSTPSNRVLRARQSEADEVCATDDTLSGCTATSGSPRWSSSLLDSVNELYGTALTDNLYSIHFATPSV